MALRARLTEELKVAMKSGDKVKLSVIRMIQSAVKNKEIDERVKPADPKDTRSPEQKEDELVMQVLKTMVKQRKESIEQFAAGGRQDLVDNETAELHILESYLPQQMSKEQIVSIVKQAIEQVGAKSPKDMGSVMKQALVLAQGRADNKIVSEVVKSQLQSLSGS